MNQQEKYQERLSRVYIGLDLHKDSHTAVAIDAFRDILATEKIENKPSEFPKLVRKIKAQTDGLEPIFGLEDVGGNGRSLAKYLVQEGYVVKEVNAALAAGYRKSNPQLEKNDDYDAQCVAEVLLMRLDSLPYADPQDLHWTMRQLVTRRKVLVKNQTTLKNQLHEQLKYHYPSYSKFFSRHTGKGALAFWEAYPSPSYLENIAVDEVAEVLRKATKNSLSTKKAKKILDITKEDGDMKEDYQEHRDFLIRSQVRSLRFHMEEIGRIEGEMAKVYSQTGYQLLTMPGIDTVTACYMIAEIGDIKRFANHGKLAKFAGIAPVKHSSAGKGKDRKSKQGNRELHNIFYLLAVQQVQVSRDDQRVPRNHAFYNYYQRKMTENKTKQQAMVCIMRRLVTIIYSMMKHRSPYKMPLVEVLPVEAESKQVA